MTELAQGTLVWLTAKTPFWCATSSGDFYRVAENEFGIVMQVTFHEPYSMCWVMFPNGQCLYLNPSYIEAVE